MLSSQLPNFLNQAKCGKINAIISGMETKTNPQFHKQEGMSIIEVLVSLFIIGAMLVLYNSSANTVTLSKNSKHQEIALKIAQTELETLRTTMFSSLPASGSFSDPLLSSLPSGTANLTMTDINSRTKQATVIVSWLPPGQSQTHTVRLDTLITAGGIGTN